MCMLMFVSYMYMLAFMYTFMCRYMYMLSSMHTFMHTYIQTCRFT